MQSHANVEPTNDVPQRPGIGELVRRLADAEAALREAAGEIDAVVLPEGHTYLLAAAQRALVASEERSKEQAALLEAVLANAPDFVLHIGLDGSIRFLNRAVPPLSREDLIGASWLGAVVSEEHEPLRRLFEKVVTTGETANHESRGIGEDGAAAWYSRRFSPIRMDGKIVGVVAIVRDITERHYLEEQARAARQFAERIIATVREPLLVADASLSLVMANQAFLSMFRLSEADTLGRAFFALEDGQWDQPQLRIALHSVLTERAEITDYELTHDAPHLDRRILLINARPIAADSGRQLILIGFQDVTGRDDQVRLLERQRQLEATNDELNQFAHSVSHDLRAPLRVIEGFARTLADDYGGQLPAEAQRHLSRIVGNVDKMGRLINDLLAFSRLAQELPQLASVRMHALVREIVAATLAGNDAGNLSIQVDDLPDARCDSRLIDQVWQNLIDNAVKYTGRREVRRIHVRGHVENTEVVYVVEDNGAGFDMKYAGRLFGVFQRLHSDAEFKGTGVGLSIVRRIVTRHGGRVWAEGAVERGAKFSFSLPRGSLKGR